MINISKTLELNCRFVRLSQGLIHLNEDLNVITWLSERMCVLTVLQYVSKTNRFRLDAVEYFLLVDIEPEKFTQSLSTREYLELRKVANHDDQHINSF